MCCLNSHAKVAYSMDLGFVGWFFVHLFIPVLELATVLTVCNCLDSLQMSWQSANVLSVRLLHTVLKVCYFLNRPWFVPFRPLFRKGGDKSKPVKHFFGHLPRKGEAGRNPSPNFCQLEIGPRRKSKGRLFSKHRPFGPMLSISRNVRPSVCVCVCVFTSWGTV